MAKLTEAQKKAVPKSQRGIPSKSGTGSFPMPDAAHAHAALMLINKAPASARPTIRAKARKVLTADKVHGSTRHERGRNKTGADRVGRNTKSSFTSGAGRKFNFKIGR